MSGCIRSRTEEFEKIALSAAACHSADTAGRAVREEPDDMRTEFQRDRDRIIHCKSFRRLKHKTQVFLSPEGVHYLTRLTHTLEVAQIARTISRALMLNEDLTEAISLGHDLGHTPFGHAGERALSTCIEGGFRHYEQSVRVVDKLEKNGAGLNLSYEVRNGILCHTAGTEADTLEGRVVRIADKIAYINHDIDDAERAGVICEDNIPLGIRRHFGNSLSERVDHMVRSVVANSVEADTVAMDRLSAEAFGELHDFMMRRVYTNPKAKGEEGKAEDMIRTLFAYFKERPDELQAELGLFISEGADRAACDMIAGMTDHFAVKVYTEKFIPLGWKNF